MRALLAFMLLVAACSKAGPGCRFAVTGAVTFQGSCSAKAFYDPDAGAGGETGIALSSPYVLSRDPVAFSGKLMLSAGKGYSAGTYTGTTVLSLSLLQLEVSDGHGSFATYGTTNGHDLDPYAGDLVLNLTSAGAASGGTLSQQTGELEWNDLGGSLVATLALDPSASQSGAVTVQVNLSGDATPAAAPASGAGSLSLSGAASGTLAVDAVTAHSVAGAALLEIQAHQTTAGAVTATNSLVFGVQASDLHTGTYGPSDVSGAMVFIVDPDKEWRDMYPGAAAGASFSLTLSSLGTASTVEGATTWTGLHGTLSANVSHAYGVIDPATVSGSF